MSLKICIVRTKNTTVTKHNFDVFAELFEKCGFEVTQTFSRKEMFRDKFDYYLASDLTTAWKLIRRGKRFFYWMQGIAPEESRMAGKSGFYFRVWSFLEKKTVKKALRIFTVSREMINHLEKKYRVDLSGKASVFPCYNTTLHKKSFFSENKYEKNVFVYAGGLTPWQCFDEIIDVYKSVEDRHPDVSLLLLARDRERAEEIAKEKGVKNYLIDYVSESELDARLAVAKFGFIIRRDDPVNNVATPTKISSYLSNGIIPIFTSAIRDFTAQAKDKKYVLRYDDESFSERLEELLAEKIDPNEIYEEYRTFFEEYYNDGKYLSDFKREIEGIIGNE